MNFGFIAVASEKTGYPAEFVRVSGFRLAARLPLYGLPEGKLSDEIRSALTEQLSGCSFVACRSGRIARALMTALELSPESARIILWNQLELACRKGGLRLPPGMRQLTDPENFIRRVDQWLKQLPGQLQAILHDGDRDLLPPHLEHTIRQELPNTPGVYYFLDRFNRPVYIGKADRLRSRVMNHFTRGTDIIKQFRLWTRVQTIQVQETGSSLVASLLEDHEIRHYWPEMNQAQKTSGKRYSVVGYRDRKGRGRVGISMQFRCPDPIVQFHDYNQADGFIRDAASRFTDTGKKQVTGPLHPGQPWPENAFDAFVTNYQLHRTITVYHTQGRATDETGYVLLVNGMFRGFGFVPADADERSNLQPEGYLNQLTPCRSSPTTEKLIASFQEHHTPAVTFLADPKAIPNGIPPKYARAGVLEFPESDFPVLEHVPF